MVFYHVKWHVMEERKIKEKKRRRQTNLALLNMNLFYIKVVAWRCSIRKLFLQNLKFKSVVHKVQPEILLKKRLLHRFFPVFL